jgi:predicted DNA repair protein MutK
MASGIFAILDDIAALMDDVAINAKLAKKKQREYLVMIWQLMPKNQQALYHREKFQFCGQLQRVPF